MFAAALFLAAAFFVTHSEPNESDALSGGWWDFTSGGIGYAIYDSKASVTGWDDDMPADIEIPSAVEHEGMIYSVTYIGDWAFGSCTSLTSVTIPSSVISIGSAAFDSCANLESVTIDSGVTTIGNDAFNNCSKLVSVTIPNSVTYIGDWAFVGCTSLKSIVIPNSVTSIGNSAFNSCTSLESAIVSSNVTAISKETFQYCSKLADVVIPDGVTSIGAAAFYGCSSLTSITIPNSVTSIGSKVFESCYALESATIPNGVISIGSNAFRNCYGLTSIIIPNSVTSIGNDAFRDSCLESVTIPDSVTSVSAFALGSMSLKSVTVTGGLDNDGKIVPGGVIDTYFKSGATGSWKLSSVYAAESLTLKDIVSLDYGPENIDGADGRELYYSDAEYICNGTSEWGLFTCSVFGTLTVTGGSESAEGAEVCFESDYDTYYADISEDGHYIIKDLPANISGKITASKDGYHLTGVHEITVPSLTESKTVGTLTLEINKYEISGTISVTEGSASAETAAVSLTSSSDPFTVYSGMVTSGGAYTIPNVPYGTSGNITASITGYRQTDDVSVTDLDDDETDMDLELKINMYAVTLTPETGISGFRYSIDGTPAIFGSGLIYVPYGSDLTVTAVPSEEYAFVSWSGDSDSKTNPLIISYVSGPVNLTANGGLIEYYVTFGSGSNYTVYANGSSQSPLSPIGVTGGGSLSFTVKTSEGYSAAPVISGIADLITQADGSYVIRNIHSNLNVTATVSADNSGNGNGSGNDPDASPGNSNDSTGDSDEGIPLWIPVLIVGAFVGCIAVAAIGHMVFVRRKG